MLTPDAEPIVYADHAATSPLLPEVIQAMRRALDSLYGNPSSLHSAGRLAHEAIESARASVARLIGAEPSEIIFTSGGSESNNTAMETFRGQTIAVSAIEHPSVLEAARARAREFSLIPVDEQGIIQLDRIPSDANLVSVMLANNELGTIEPVADLVNRCKKHNTFVHSDATQALGKLPIDVKALDLDYLTVSAHKIGGPTGVGALYARGGATLSSVILGGRQESRRRAGTPNLLGIIGFGAAAEYCHKNQTWRQWAKIAPLRDELKTRILCEIPGSRCNSPRENCLPNILNISFQAAEGESIQLYLDHEGVCVGTGSACAAGDLMPSHVIMATKNNAEIAHDSVRFSLSLDTTATDIAHIMDVLPDIVKRLQDMSTIKVNLEENHE